MAPLRRLVPESVEWARLEPAGETSVSQFIDSIFNETPTSAGNAIVLQQSVVQCLQLVIRVLMLCESLSLLLYYKTYIIYNKSPLQNFDSNNFSVSVCHRVEVSF